MSPVTLRLTLLLICLQTVVWVNFDPPPRDTRVVFEQGEKLSHWLLEFISRAARNENEEEISEHPLRPTVFIDFDQHFREITDSHHVNSIRALLTERGMTKLLTIPLRI